jgi:hypothetical protein
MVVVVLVVVNLHDRLIAKSRGWGKDDLKNAALHLHHTPVASLTTAASQATLHAHLYPIAATPFPIPFPPYIFPLITFLWKYRHNVRDGLADVRFVKTASEFLDVLALAFQQPVTQSVGGTSPQVALH